MTYSFTEKKRIRNNFGTRESVLKEPDLLSIQINSFNTFIQAGAAEKENIGLHSVFQSVFPITALNGYAEIEYLDYEEGGRHTPFFNNYRPQFYFRTTDVTGAVELPSGTEMVSRRRSFPCIDKRRCCPDFCWNGS